MPIVSSTFYIELLTSDHVQLFPLPTRLRLVEKKNNK